LYPAAGEDSIEPADETFCFYATESFLDMIEKMDQLRSEAQLQKDVLKAAIKAFVNYFRSIMNKDTDHYRQCIGMREIEDRQSADNTATEQGNNKGKVVLSEAEKQDLENGLGPKRSSRLLSKGSFFHGKNVVNKVPVGSIAMTPPTATTAAVQQNRKVGSHNSSSKKQKVADPPELIDLRTRGQKSADTKQANKLAEEARIKDAVNKQLLEHLKKQPHQPPPPPLPPQYQVAKGQSHQQQPLQNQQPPTRAQQREEMTLDAGAYENIAMKFETFADRRVDKMMQ
jgi:hypothetical protein